MKSLLAISNRKFHYTHQFHIHCLIDPTAQLLTHMDRMGLDFVFFGCRFVEESFQHE